MAKIWIVEYGYDGIGEANCFSSAWSTKKAAIAAAHREADGALDEREDEELKKLVRVNPSGCEQGTWVQIGRENPNDPTDWWIVRQVPFNR